jgi:hypothetical protein
VSFATRSIALGSAILGLWGCSSGPPPAPQKVPVRWIVVEKRLGEINVDGWGGDGQVDPQAIVLTMQPLYREDLEWEVVVDPHEYVVEVLGISPSGQASPGETVSATVRVGKARPGECYRLVARPSSVEVQLIGAAECTVRGGSPAVFQFTSLRAGRGGIAIGVERLD